MAILGSVFLGDAHHHRVFSTTPPSSPLLPTPPSAAGSQTPAVHPQQEMQAPSVPETQARSPLEISPAVSLELRVRWLEALLLGVRQDAAKERRKTAVRNAATQEDERKIETLYHRAEDVQRRLDSVVASNDGLRRFMERYDKHSQFLMPSFALSGLSSSSSSIPSYSSMSSPELDALLSDMEEDIRAADRDLREIDALEKRGVTEAGNLPQYEALQPRLQALVKAHEEDLAKAASLENRMTVLLEKHTNKVDALSELFVAWNDVITEAEDRTSKVEKEKEEQRRLGYDESEASKPTHRGTYQKHYQ